MHAISDVSLVKMIPKAVSSFEEVLLQTKGENPVQESHTTDGRVSGGPSKIREYPHVIYARHDRFQGFREKKSIWMNIDHYVPGIHFEDIAIERHPKLLERRVFRNEVPVYPQYYPRTIYLVRDPRSVLVSYYHMYRTIFNDTTTPLQDFVEEYLRNGNIQRYEPQIDRWDRQVSRLGLTAQT